jgi:hypothetical protein
MVGARQVADHIAAVMPSHMTAGLAQLCGRPCAAFLLRNVAVQAADA